MTWSNLQPGELKSRAIIGFRSSSQLIRDFPPRVMELFDSNPTLRAVQGKILVPPKKWSFPSRLLRTCEGIIVYEMLSLFARGDKLNDVNIFITRFLDFASAVDHAAC